MSEIIGKIIVINDTLNVSDNFSKREIVIETEEQYKQSILVEFHKDKCSVLDSYKINENVKVSYNLKGRSWTNPQGETKYFNSIVGWKIELLETGKKPKEKEPDDHADISWLED